MPTFATQCICAVSSLLKKITLLACGQFSTSNVTLYIFNSAGLTYIIPWFYFNSSTVSVAVHSTLWDVLLVEDFLEWESFSIDFQPSLKCWHQSFIGFHSLKHSWKIYLTFEFLPWKNVANSNKTWYILTVNSLVAQCIKKLNEITLLTE